MSRDDIFTSEEGASSAFAFDDKVAAVFDDMLNRSVPFYGEQQKLITEIARRFWIPDTPVVDMGCSLGTTLLNIASELKAVETFIGFDNSQAMIDKALVNIDKAQESDRIQLRLADLNASLDDVELENASVVTICWTLQFIRPLQRDRLIKKIYDSMADGGVLITTEKVLTNDSNMNRFFIDFYYDYKRRHLSLIHI